MNHKLKSLVYLLPLFILFSSTALRAQLAVSTGLTPTQYVQQLVGAGVTVGNVTFVGANGTSSGTAHSTQNGNYEFDVPIYQIGTFSNGNSTNAGMNDGIILSSGTVQDAGFNASFFANSYVNSNVNNDADLKTLGGKNTYDKAILEFDFIPTGTSISFDYVFASEEYPNWVGQSYNDAFGFFLSGPGISGTYSNNSINIALLPSSSTPVSINSINNGSGDCQPIFGSGGNTPPSGPCTNCQYYVSNCGGTGFCYGGFTKVLQAQYNNLQCGQTYHIKIAIADLGDANWDSAILLKKNSLNSPTIDISTNPSNAIVCQGSSIDITAQMQNSSGGTYTWSTGQTGQTITVTPSSNQDYIVTYTYSGCSVKDTVHVIVDNCNGCTPPNLNIQPLSACSPNSVDLNNAIGTSSATATKTYYNSQADANNATNPIGNTVTTSGSYWLRAENPSDATCFNVYEIQVTVSSPTYTAAIVGENCGDKDGSITLTANGGITPYSYSIDNGTTTQNNGVFNGLSAGSYNVIITDSIGCSATGIDVVPNIGGPNITQTTPVNPSCQGTCDGSITLSVSGGNTPYTYEWYDANNTQIGTNSDNITNLCAGSYTVIVKDNNCSISTTVVLTTTTLSDPTFTLTNYCEGKPNSATNIASTGGTFEFSPAVSDGATINSATGEITNGVGGTTYTVQYTTSGACSQSSTQQVTVVKNPTADFTANPMQADLSNTNVTFSNSSQNANSYSWDFGDGATSTEQNPSHAYPNTVAGTYNATLTTANSLGCTATKNVTIVIDSLVIEYTIPNVFSPNGDAVNDEFQLINHLNIKNINVIILNRWGNLVFASDDVNFKWNGKNQNNGQNCTDGTYFYKMELESYDSKKYVEHGFVTLTR
ncbi:MAG TPA: choice-of-anchor L domain-containing protein [Crocinitomicaceae bacterium]|nr:choice-of-anchor L domain-containing protein [Crocinitomicaceae bacterium]